MPTWDYDTIAWEAGSSWQGARGVDGMKEMLRAKGKEGWELTSVVGEEDSGHRFFFKKIRS